MRSRGYLLTGAVVGTALGALATPMFYDFGSLVPGLSADDGHRSDAAAKTVFVDGRRDTYGDHVVAASLSEPLDPMSSTPGDGSPTGPDTTTTTTTISPSDTTPTTTAPSDPATSTSSASTSTTAASANAKTACASLKADNEAKLRVPAARRGELNTVSSLRYLVHVTLVAAQSSDRTAENENRLNGLAAITELTRADFQPTADGRYRASMTNGALCRALFLRTVIAIEISDTGPNTTPTTTPPTTTPPTSTPPTSAASATGAR